MSEIASRVKAIIVDKLGVEESEVTTEASFTNDLGADSLDTVELIMEFEKEFGISIPDDLSLIHISEPTRQAEISYAVFCLKKKKKKTSM